VPVRLFAEAVALLERAAGRISLSAERNRYAPALAVALAVALEVAQGKGCSWRRCPYKRCRSNSRRGSSRDMDDRLGMLCNRRQPMLAVFALLL
jgi:hypothetical protein